MSERRLEDRFLCAELVTVDWVAADSESEFGSGGPAGKALDAPRSVEAVLEDISALGACVQVEDRIPLGAAISISAHRAGGNSEPDNAGHSGGARFSGYVSYCEYRDFGYFVGIRLSDETPWSTGAFEPEHLTNLAAMSRRGGGRPKRRSPLVLSPAVH
jgi:hypothetical protein